MRGVQVETQSGHAEVLRIRRFQDQRPARPQRTERQLGQADLLAAGEVFDDVKSGDRAERGRGERFQVFDRLAAFHGQIGLPAPFEERFVAIDAPRRLAVIPQQGEPFSPSASQIEDGRLGAPAPEASMKET